jgi:23S rRNA pseudouridine1911/1915/1917 synthase
VLYKPPGLVVHLAPSHWFGTLVNALLHHFGSFGALSIMGGIERPGLVHRLDKETSGSDGDRKDRSSPPHLAGQFKHHTIRRVYEVARQNILPILWHIRCCGRPVGRPRNMAKYMFRYLGLDLGRNQAGRRADRIGARAGRERAEKILPRTARPKESATAYAILERIGKLATRVVLFPRSWAHVSEPSTPGGARPSRLGRLDLWRAQGAGAGVWAKPGGHGAAGIAAVEILAWWLAPWPISKR